MRVFPKRLVQMALSAAVMISAPCANALDGREWSVASKFKDKKAKRNLSGAACADDRAEKAWCLVVNDETGFAQFFSIADRELVPTGPIRLLQPAVGEDRAEIDAEAVAYNDGYYYVTGSHGLSRKKGKFRRPHFMIFRFPVDPETGQPGFKFSADLVAPQIQRSEALRAAIKAAPLIGAYAEQPLDQNGANIEGLAVADGQMYFGFRGPSIDGQAFMLQLPVSYLFPGKAGSPIVHKIPLGDKIGVRDIARVSDGLLILSGHVNQREVAPVIHFWKPGSGTSEVVDTLPVVAGGQAETILVLEENVLGATTSYRILVIYDGPRDGRPTEYVISR